jgi:hypothetical protein
MKSHGSQYRIIKGLLNQQENQIDEEETIKNIRKYTFIGTT